MRIDKLRKMIAMLDQGKANGYIFSADIMERIDDLYRDMWDQVQGEIKSSIELSD
jgi:hypothetical protein